VRFLAAGCVGVAAWCSLGTVGLVGNSTAARLALLPPLWLLPTFILTAHAVLHVGRVASSRLPPLFLSSLAILPWLPVPLPAAALLWTGPLLAVVWAAAARGVIASGPAPAGGKWLTNPRHASATAAILAFAVYMGTAWWLSPVLPEGDEPHYLTITQSLLLDGDLQIENNHARGDYLSYSLHAARPDYLRRGTNGAIYSIHAPGLPVLIAPAFFLSGYPGVIVFLGVVGALGTALVCAWRIG
jgi:hypothetical protein